MPGKRVLPLAQATRGAGDDSRLEVWADAGCNDLFGVNPDSVQRVTHSLPPVTHNNNTALKR